MYTLRAAEERIRTRDRKKWFPHQSSRKVGNQDKGRVTQKGSFQEETMRKTRLFRMQIEWKRKGHMQQGKREVYHNVHRELW